MFCNLSQSSFYQSKSNFLCRHVSSFSNLGHPSQWKDLFSQCFYFSPLIASLFFCIEVLNAYLKSETYTKWKTDISCSMGCGDSWSLTRGFAGGLFSRRKALSFECCMTMSEPSVMLTQQSPHSLFYSLLFLLSYFLLLSPALIQCQPAPSPQSFPSPDLHFAVLHFNILFVFSAKAKKSDSTESHL